MPDLAAEFFAPHDEAAAIVASKPAVTRTVFDKLLPELRARAMVVTGVEGANTVERIRDEIADYTRGQTQDGTSKTWDDAKAEIAKTLEAESFSQQAADRRATLLLRTHGFQAYQAANYRVAMEDDDTTHLQYLATEDDRVRNSHLALNGIILPKHDVFWDKHYPPWEWGCRCRVAPINQDLLALERDLDSKRKPEDRLVIEGPVADRLRSGQIVRGELTDRDGRTVGMGTHDVTPPSDKPGADKAFQWHPSNLRITSDQLRQRYDPVVWSDFEAWANKAKITGETSVKDWIDGGAISAPPASPPAPSSRPETISPVVVGKDEQLLQIAPRAQSRILEAEAELLKYEREHCYVFDARGKRVAEYIGDANSIPLTPEALRTLRHRTVTHQHPRGGTFSPKDVYVACIAEAAELRVVTRENTFSLRSGTRKLSPRTLINVKQAIARLARPNMTLADWHELWKTVAAENGLYYVVS